MGSSLKRKLIDFRDQRHAEQLSLDNWRSLRRSQHPIQAVFFDVDGVLLDSLASHLRFCDDKSREYGLGLRIPNASEFKGMVRAGTRVSPMKMFFLAVGFPELDAEKADQEYQRIFAAQYPPKPFAGALEVLTRLHAAGMPLGIVTANVMGNVERALGPKMAVFDSRCCFTKDDGRYLTKVEALRAGAEILGLPSHDVIYVGDQPADAEAATRAEAQFLGVTFGWGIGREGNPFSVADNLSSVGDYVLARIE